jgi:PAS domain S-box-containing protein
MSFPVLSIVVKDDGNYVQFGVILVVRCSKIKSGNKMNDKEKRLQQLRQRAEHALDAMDIAPEISVSNIEDIVHELRVYYAELEIQLEDLRNANEQLTAARERYADLFNFAPVGYVVTDTHGHIEEMNLTAQVLFGIEIKNWQGRMFADLLHTDEREAYHTHMQTSLRTGDARETDVKVYGADNTVFFARLTTQLHDNASRTLRTAVLDISAAKRAQEALERALAQQQAVNKLQERVLSVIAHEFRTPLTIIISSVELLDRYADRMSEDKKAQRRHQIRNLAWYLNDIVGDIHAVEASGSDLPSLKPTTLDLLPYVQEIVNDIASLSEGEQRVVIEAEAIPLIYPVTWDQSLLRRILTNLLSNANKYSDGMVTCKIDTLDELVRFQVIDHGIGIPPEDLPHIYQPFYRGKNGNFQRGTGIGLYVTERAVTVHGGTIDCETQPGKGTTFTVVLPRHVLTPEPE